MQPNNEHLSACYKAVAFDWPTLSLPQNKNYKQQYNTETLLPCLSRLLFIGVHLEEQIRRNGRVKWWHADNHDMLVYLQGFPLG